MNTLKSFDWFGLAPYGAGSPPAFVLAINLYKSVMTVVSPDLWGFAIIVAGLGIVGMMSVEIGTYKMLARAFADKEWKAAGLAFLGACTVTGLIVFSVYAGSDTRSLFSSTLVMLVGYLAIMVREYLERGKANRALVTDNDLEKMRLEVEKSKQEAAAERAKARAAKATSGQNGRPMDATGQERKLDPDKLAWVRAYYEKPENKGKSAASMIGVAGCPFTSRETARQYKAAL